MRLISTKSLLIIQQRKEIIVSNEHSNLSDVELIVNIIIIADAGDKPGH